MIKPHLLKFLLIFLFIPVSWLNALVITEIRVGELKKTREATVLKIIELKPGDEIDEEDIEDIEQKLRRSGLFVAEEIDVSFTRDGAGAVLLLNLKDRFSLIPIPYFAVSNGSVSGGGFFMESNLLGTGNSLFFGGLYSAEFAFMSLNYIERKFLGSSWDIGLGAVYTDSETEVEDTRGNVVLTDSGLTLGGIAFSRLDLSPFHLGVSLKTGLKEIASPELDVGYISPSVSLEYDGQFLGDFFAEGLRTEVEYEQGVYTREYDATVELNMHAAWAVLPLECLQFSVAADMLAFFGDDILSPGVTSTLLSNAVHAGRLVQSTVKITPVLADFSWGFLALPVGYEAGFLDGLSGEDELFYGPSFGLMLYLKKVAIPALSLRYGINLETGKDVYSFSMGFQR